MRAKQREPQHMYMCWCIKRVYFCDDTGTGAGHTDGSRITVGITSMEVVIRCGE